MRTTIIAGIIGYALVGSAVLPANANTPGPQVARLDPRKVIETSERALGRPLGNYSLTDSTGRPLALSEYRGKPLVISLIYTACSSVCPPTTQRLIEAVDEARRTIGLDRFAVLTIGFDARHDTPKQLAQFAATQGVQAPNWRLATASAPTIEALLRDLGFSYVAIAGGFDHITQTTVIDSDGRIYRHIYGDDFPTQMFMEPLKEAVFGTTTPSTFAGLLDRIRYICTVYDPSGGRYRFDYAVVTGSIFGALSLIGVAALIMREWRKTSRA